ncbi:lasso peptide biosynthesis B2 protein [Kibdelosporangium persicum]|uniref:lasso peptide biosynthesis B2 protein n=1 Tax=Kibdelosporangium persicum TaxID=2698649 RepID=UPI001FE5C19D|nr:lasso peptide biosynthesis B2 protein [Kibdelosporangium persicum]
MSAPMVNETADAPPPLWMRPLARLAVLLALVIAKLSPERQFALLNVLRRGARASTVRETHQARNAVLFSSVLCTGPWCLQRSIATALLCRLCGTWPEWCVGVRTEPFRAHAWVQVDGTPVDEDTEQVDQFHRMVVIRPRS